MQLEWMGEYREVVESLIHYCNVYAGVYKKEQTHGTEVSFSFAQIQVLEYLLENEELNQNMSCIATRLGITFSTFSKVVNKLESKGLLEKYYLEGNKKNIVVRVSDLGRQVYTTYSEEILKKHFSAMFEHLKEIPSEYLPSIAKALKSASLNKQPETECAPVLIPCKKHCHKCEDEE
jgi:DNA-binding MarR family transcriptional regulator